MAGEVPRQPSSVTVQGDSELNRQLLSPIVPTQYLFETSFGVNRGKRMARQRRGTFNTLPFASSSTFHVQQQQPTLPIQPPIPRVQNLLPRARVIETRRLRFLLQKELRQTDVSSLGRVVLPKRPAEAFLPQLIAKDGIYMSMEDMDYEYLWSFKFRYWPNNNSRMYVLENTGDFVRMHGLRVGDFMMLYKDDETGKYVVRGKKVALELQDAYYDYARTGFTDGNSQPVHDYEVNRSSNIDLNFPVMDDMNMPFFYDNPYHNGFLGGGQVTNFPELDPLTSFGSVDNFSLDDLFNH